MAISALLFSVIGAVSCAGPAPQGRDHSGWVPVTQPEMPAPGQRSDAQIRTDFLTAIVADSEVDPFDFRFDVANGEIRLRGNTRSDFEKRHLEALASKVPGARGVRNRIHVGEAPPPAAQEEDDTGEGADASYPPVLRGPRPEVVDALHD